MKFYKLKTGISEVYKITTREDFEEKIREKGKYTYKNSDGENYGLAVCPRCDNPIRILGLYKKLNGIKPYAKHHNKSTAIAVINKSAYLHCPYANPTSKKGFDKSKILPLTDFEKQLYYTMRDYFDKAIYMLNKNLDFYISDKFAKKLLEGFTKNCTYRNELANNSNLPFMLLDNFDNFTMVYRLVKKESELWKVLNKRKDINFIQKDEIYDKIVPNTGCFVFLEGHFYAHTVTSNDDGDVSEKIKFGVIDSPDIDKERFFQRKYEIKENEFQNLCKNESYRNNNLLEMAKNIMPDL